MSKPSVAAALAGLDQFSAGLSEVLSTPAGSRDALLLYEKLELIEATPALFATLNLQEQKIVFRMATIYLVERMASSLARNEE